jgi:Putative Ice-binding-like adhesive domain
MNINHPKRNFALAGNILLVSLVITGIIGFLVVSYLKLIHQQGAFTMRSQVWDSCMPVVEAGIEETMAHLNDLSGSNLVTDGWETDLINGGVSKKRIMGDGYFIANITYTNLQQPVITSSGFLPAPVTIASASELVSVPFASITLPSMQGIPTGYISRTVRVLAQKQPFFAKGIVAKHTIDLNGNDILSDSFDSSDSSYSGPGGSYDPTKNKDNGDIATNSGISNPLNAGNANIMGRLSTGPGGGISIGPNGSVGSKAWVTAMTPGIESGYSADDMNVGFMDVQRPFTGGAFTPTSGVFNGQNYTYVLNSGNYQLMTLSMSGSQKMVVTGNAVLYVPGNINLSGKAFIEVAPGANLKLYVGGTTASISGNGIVNNNTMADSFTYFGLPSNQSLNLSGNGQFTGAIYAPNADLTLNGGGNNTVDFIGASVVKSVLFNGHFNFHYDEALGNFGPTTSYTIVSWNEI